MFTQKIETHTVNTWLQIILMCITSLLITIIIALNLMQFEAFEPKSIELGTPDTEITGHIKNIPQIESGLFVREISELNLNAGTLTANLLIWFSFNPKLVEPELVGKFTFERAEEKFRSDPIIEVNKPDEYFVKYNVRLKCAMPFNYEDFPVDDHRIDFIVTNYFLDATKVNFKTDHDLVTLHPNVNLQGWRIVGLTAQTGYLKNVLNPHNTQQVLYNPREVFGFDLERDGVRQVLSTILPLLLIFFTALFTFAINPSGADYYNTLALSIASLMALIAYRFVIETVSPQTGYFMLADFVFLYFLIATLVILFVNALGEAVTSRQKTITTTILHCTTIATFFVLFEPWRTF